MPEVTDGFSSHADALNVHKAVHNAAYKARMPVGKLANIRSHQNVSRTQNTPNPPKNFIFQGVQINGRE